MQWQRVNSLIQYEEVTLSTPFNNRRDHSIASSGRITTMNMDYGSYQRPAL